jgi:hypothetical protein
MLLHARWHSAGCGRPFGPFGAGNPRIRNFDQYRFVLYGALFCEPPALSGILAIFFCVIHPIHQYFLALQMPELGTWNFSPKFRIKSARAPGTKSLIRVFILVPGGRA